MGVAEPKPVRTRALAWEYRFDRLLPEKLAQVYRVLVPDKRWPIAGARVPSAPARVEMTDGQTGRDLRARLL